jgi:hypothetical protein
MRLFERAPMQIDQDSIHFSVRHALSWRTNDCWPPYILAPDRRWPQLLGVVDIWSVLPIIELAKHRSARRL